MENFEEKLNSFLNDPNAMHAVFALAQQLSSQGGEETRSASKEEQQTTADFDPSLLAKLLPLLQKLRSENTQATALLYALQPYLSESKQGKVDRAVKLAHIIHVGKAFLTEGGWELV